MIENYIIEYYIIYYIIYIYILSVDSGDSSCCYNRSWMATFLFTLLGRGKTASGMLTL